MPLTPLTRSSTFAAPAMLIGPGVALSIEKERSSSVDFNAQRKPRRHLGLGAPVINP